MMHEKETPRQTEKPEFLVRVPSLLELSEVLGRLQQKLLSRCSAVPGAAPWPGRWARGERGWGPPTTLAKGIRPPEKQRC